MLLKKIAYPIFLAILFSPFLAKADTLSVDTHNLRQVIDFYKNVYLASESATPNWTGNLASCNSGSVSQAFKDATLLRINYFRAMAGVPANVVFDASLNEKSQKAALIFSRNNTLTHSPASSLACYSPDGFLGANKSNITLGNIGPAGINAFIEDFGFGSNNSHVGHRRWLLYPRQVAMGFGAIPAVGSNKASSAVYVLGSQNTHSEASSWPPAGYVPRQVVYGRWSYSYPGADFSATRVYQTSKASNTTKEYTKYTVANGYGDNTVVWVPDLTAPMPEYDTYTVRLENVIVSGDPRTITYDVTRFDPLTADPDAAPNTAPVLTTISAQTVAVDSSGLTIALAATDIDNDTITFNASTNSPSALQLTVTNNSLRITPKGSTGQFNVTVAASDGALSDSKTFQVYVFSSAASNDDLDGDGVSNDTEQAQGTDPEDAGSYLENLTSPIYTSWNGFLQMFNILELVNPNNKNISVKISLFDINGQRTDQKTVSILAKSQLDVVVNELQGYAENSYGIIKLEFSGTIDGRVMHYRLEENGQFGRDQFEFAYGVPFSNARFGTTAIGFNTYQPSSAASEQQNQVANWLTIVNLATSEKKFVVKSYDSNGKELNTSTVNIPSFGRVDIDGGHGIAGPSVIGLHIIQPTQPKSTPYFAQLSRYGETNKPASSSTRYSFAFPLNARAGIGQAIYAPISNQFGEDNWVEVVNTLNKTINVTATFHNQTGAVAHTESFSLNPFSQRHLYANTHLAPATVGFIKIVPATANSVIAQSMFYFKNPLSGAMLSMYGIEASQPRTATIRGSYNLFLGMENWLRIANTNNAEATIKLSTNTFGATQTKTIKIAPRATVSLPLHETTTYNLPVDSYGTVTLQTQGSNAVHSSIMRLRRNAAAIDFAAPTPVR